MWPGQLIDIKVRHNCRKITTKTRWSDLYVFLLCNVIIYRDFSYTNITNSGQLISMHFTYRDRVNQQKVTLLGENTFRAMCPPRSRVLFVDFNASELSLAAHLLLLCAICDCLWLSTGPMTRNSASHYHTRSCLASNPCNDTNKANAFITGGSGSSPDASASSASRQLIPGADTL